MPKTTTGAFKTHLAGETTTLTTLWRITRVDDVEFFFTDHDVDVPFEGNIYEAAIGYDRTAISNQVGLSVDNLDVSGFLDSSSLTDTELRAGLFDFAEVRIFLVNFEDLSQGVLKMRRGKFGEIGYQDSGFFQTELRGLTQAYSQKIVELYEPECRADLGDSRCKVDLFPDVVLRNTAYIVGDILRVSELLAGIPGSTLLVPGDTDENDISVNGAIGTLGSQAVVQTSQKKFGAGSIEFNPSGSVDPSQGFVSYPDIAPYAIGSNEFTIEGWVRIKDLTETIQIFASHYLNTGNQRSWWIRRNAGNIEVFFSDDGTSVSPALTITGVFTPGWVIDTDYHFAVARDVSNDVRMFIDGVQYGSTTSVSFAIHDSTAVLHLGKYRSAGFDDLPLDGFIDDFRFVVGAAIYTAPFTPPVAAHPSGPAALIPSLVAVDFDDRIYTVTVAGTTGGIQPSYNIGLGATTVDGGVTLSASEAFTRAGIVSKVNSQSVFSMTFPEGADGRDIVDWYKYGAIGWETGNNAFNVGLNMEVKNNNPSVTTGVATLAVDDTNTISRSVGSFVTDGFVVGQQINTSGFTDGANNGTFEVLAVAALTLNTVETTLVAESGTGDEVITSEELIALFLPMPFEIEVGDTFNIYAGCDKRLFTCADKFANVVNFRGEPFVPGQDAFIAVQSSR